MAEVRTQPRTGQARQLAALDLGSNSFHMLVAQESGGRIQVLDKLKEMVRLADGLDSENHLHPDAAERALDCLARFGQRLRNIDAHNIRVVGTNTLRRARDAGDFLRQAEQALGCKVEIISGREEARLIFLGVSYDLEDSQSRRLVVDIGGGSTEFIIGRHFDAEMTESLYMGCVGVTKAFFADGKLRPAQFQAAVDHARLELEPIAARYLDAGWDSAIGASGTIVATEQVIRQLAPDHKGITHAGLVAIRDALLEARSIDRINLPGLSSDRSAVFAGGVAILTGIFESLEIDTMEASSGALREGLLYDLLGRVRHHDVRENSVHDLCERYHVDQRHANRVRESALALLAQVAETWELTDPKDQQQLGWAAELHEIGMDISHSQYHKHGGYLLANMDLPGFSKLDQQELASLVRAHRRKFPLEPGTVPLRSLRLAVLLRIAVVLHRNRTARPLPHVALSVQDDRLTLTFEGSWLDSHPLTRLDLAQEADYLSVIPHKLEILTR